MADVQFISTITISFNSPIEELRSGASQVHGAEMRRLQPSQDIKDLGRALETARF